MANPTDVPGTRAQIATDCTALLRIPFMSTDRIDRIKGQGAFWQSPQFAPDAVVQTLIDCTPKSAAVESPGGVKLAEFFDLAGKFIGYYEVPFVNGAPPLVVYGQSLDVYQQRSVVPLAYYQVAYTQAFPKENP